MLSKLSRWGGEGEVLTPLTTQAHSPILTGKGGLKVGKRGSPVINHKGENMKEKYKKRDDFLNKKRQNCIFHRSPEARVIFIQ